MCHEENVGLKQKKKYVFFPIMCAGSPFRSSNSSVSVKYKDCNEKISFLKELV